MAEHDHKELRRLFDLAIATPIGERDALLARECAGKSALKDRVLAMIAAAEDERFLDSPTLDIPFDDAPPSGSGETIRRKDSLAATDAPGFQHGRFEPGQRLGSRYRIVGLLGKGGMGEVYRADDLELGQSVALKFLPERVTADSSWLRRFRNEVRTARQVAHPNVCRIYDITEVDGHVFLSMEYVDGEDLDSVLRRLGRPSRDKAIEIARQICLGLAAAHERRVLHRDLKPANIMIDGRGCVRITDFGLAGFTDELEQAEARAGTPAYMAPEQLAHGKVSVRSEIYSLGLILYELFTGKCVFQADDIEALKAKHSSGSVSTPSSIAEDIDPAVERVIMRCLEHQPDQRPPSVYQVLAALPGGDPLAAALAVGETPSPGLVANARDAGGLRPSVAIGLSIALVAFVAVIYLLWARTLVMPERSPAVLSVVAEGVLEQLGYADLPVNTTSGYDVNMRLTESLRSSPRSYRDVAEPDGPPRFRYWRRWSRGEYTPTDFHFPEVFAIDGPTTTPDETATVALDSTGRLLGLLVGPALPRASPAPIEDVGWSLVFERAGVNESDATEIPLVKQPPVHCDEVVAWQFRGADESGAPETVQMGAAGGLVNYFEIVGLDEAMSAPNPPSDTLKQVFGGFVKVVVIILAWRNLLLSRADRRNAFRCALITGVLYAVMEILASAGMLPIGDLLGGRAGGHIALHALTVWMVYMAIEPYVRRFWPRMLVGVMRLLAGRLRDPAVGREVLIGVVTGVGLAALWALALFTDWRSLWERPGQLPPWESLQALMSPTRYVGHRAHVAAWVVLDGAMFAGWLVVLRFLSRHSGAAVVLAIILVASMAVMALLSIGVSIWLAAACGIISGVSFVLLFTRVGILAGIAATFVLRLANGVFASDLDAWSSPYAMADLAILLGVVAYGLWVSLAGQPIFRDMLAEPRPA